MRLFHRLAAVGFVGLALACNSGGPSSTVGNVKVSGVVAAGGAGLPGATVRVGTLAMATTDSTGHFEVVFPAAVGSTFPIGATHASHASAYRQVAVTDKVLQQNFLLQPFDVSQAVTLPTDGQPAAAVSVTKGSYTFSLSIPAGALQTASGAAATGGATVNVAYWNPNSVLANPPSPLRGQLTNGADTSRLFTAGMADIVIEQNGQALSVAAGKTLQLTFSATPDLASIASNASSAGLFGLWSVDQNSGIWQLESKMDGSALSFSSSANQFVANIPHLSAWNIDGYASDNACLTGKISDNCGNALASQQVTLWVMTDASDFGQTGTGEITQYLIDTAADGSFCANIWGSADNDSNLQAGARRSGKLFYFVSAPWDPSQAACNPTGKTTYQSLCNSPAARKTSDNHWCTGAEPGIYAGSGQGYDTNIFAPYFFGDGVAKCGTPSVNSVTCGSCPGKPWKGSNTCMMTLGYNDWRNMGPAVEGQCSDLGTLKVPYCKTPGNTVNSACSGIELKEADRCDATKTPDCCRPGVLECADGYCVPVHPAN